MPVDRLNSSDHAIYKKVTGGRIRNIREEYFDLRNLPQKIYMYLVV
jgi:hypothetical protein